MAIIHLSRSGQTLGQFEQERVREGLVSGEFIETDLAWTEGMATWRPLSEFDDFLKGTGPVPGPPPAPPETAAIPATMAQNIPVSASGLPWENRQRIGFVQAFLQTVPMVLLRPKDAFGVMQKEGDIMDPLLFTLLGGTVGTAIGLLLQMLLQSTGLAFGGSDALFALGAMGAMSLFVLLLVPIVVVVVAFVAAAIFHLGLMLFGGANRTFETTFRVVCYAGGSANLLQLLPICGGILALVWGIVLYIIGLATAHRTTTGKAVGAVLLPFLLCCGGIFLLTMLIPLLVGLAH